MVEREFIQQAVAHVAHMPSPEGDVVEPRLLNPVESYIKAYSACLTPIVALQLVLEGKANALALGLFRPETLGDIQSFWEDRRDPEADIIDMCDASQERMNGLGLHFPEDVEKAVGEERLDSDSRNFLRALEPVKLNFEVGNNVLEGLNEAISHLPQSTSRRAVQSPHDWLASDQATQIALGAMQAGLLVDMARASDIREKPGSLVHMYAAAHSLAGLLLTQGDTPQNYGRMVHDTIISTYSTDAPREQTA